MTTPAFAFSYLLICQNSLTVWTPIHRRVAAFNQSALPELEENPLTPAIILRVTCYYRAIPVVRKAHALKACFLCFDVSISPSSRVTIVLDCRIFGRQSKSIPTHRMKYIISTHGVITCRNVTKRIVTNMAHVNIARRIREHLKYIALWLRLVFASGICARIRPDLLPMGLYFMRVVLFHRSILFLVSKTANYKLQGRFIRLMQIDFASRKTKRPSL